MIGFAARHRQAVLRVQETSRRSRSCCCLTLAGGPALPLRRALGWLSRTCRRVIINVGCMRARPRRARRARQGCRRRRATTPAAVKLLQGPAGPSPAFATACRTPSRCRVPGLGRAANCAVTQPSVPGLPNPPSLACKRSLHHPPPALLCHRSPWYRVTGSWVAAVWHSSITAAGQSVNSSVSMQTACGQCSGVSPVQRRSRVRCRGGHGKQTAERG